MAHPYEVIVLLLAIALAPVLWQLRAPLSNLHRFWVYPSEVSTLILGGKTDKALSALRRTHGDYRAFNQLYAENNDPWELGNPSNRYQQRKYRTLLSLLPKERRFYSALDAGCGIGFFTRMLAGHAERILGVDLSQSAIDRAKEMHRDVTNLEFMSGDIFNLPETMNGQFDLVVLADVLYYVPSETGDTLKTITRRIAKLLTPGGCCAIVNHYFLWDQPTRSSKRIYAAFQRTPGVRVVRRYWVPFFSVVILEKEGQPEKRRMG